MLNNKAKINPAWVYAPYYTNGITRQNVLVTLREYRAQYSFQERMAHAREFRF